MLSCGNDADVLLKFFFEKFLFLHFCQIKDMVGGEIH
jgi:hypothetical protein